MLPNKVYRFYISIQKNPPRNLTDFLFAFFKYRFFLVNYLC
jgi:hypothetical protein